MELIAMKAMEGITARYPYVRVQVSNINQDFFYKIDNSYGYMLRRVRVKYPGKQLVPFPASMAWLALTGFSNQWVKPTAAYTATKNPLVFYTPAPGGVTGAVEPAWPTQPGTAVVDGGVTWYGIDALAPYPSSFPYASTVFTRLLSIANRMKVEFFDQANLDKLRQTAPVETELFLTPGGEGSYTRNAPSPFDLTAYGVNFSANPPYFSSTLNFLYRYGENIQIRFTGQRVIDQIVLPSGGIVSVTPYWCPNFIDVFLEGYYVSEKQFQVFKGRGL
jgi:hypothetical protein